MRLDHVAMYVTDLEAAKDFFVRYFGAYAGEKYHNHTTGFHSYFLRFDSGAWLELMRRPGVEDHPKDERTGWSHVAFSLGSREAVEELTARLKDDGYEIVSGPRTTGDGYYESSVVGFEGNLIELTV